MVPVSSIYHQMDLLLSQFEMRMEKYPLDCFHINRIKWSGVKNGLMPSLKIKMDNLSTLIILTDESLFNNHKAPINKFHVDSQQMPSLLDQLARQFFH